MRRSTAEDLGQLIADALRCEPERAAPLAQLVHEKTGGNPFFAIQFIIFARRRGTAHVSIMMSGAGPGISIAFTPEDTPTTSWTSWSGNSRACRRRHRTHCSILACLGNIAEITTLSIVLGISEEQSTRPLARRSARNCSSARHAPTGSSMIAFRKPPIRLCPDEQRGEAHIRIGRLLAAHTPPEKQEEAIFDIVNQLNRGAALDRRPRRARAAGRAQPDRGQASKGLHGLCLGAYLFHCRRGMLTGRRVGSQA